MNAEEIMDYFFFLFFFRLTEGNNECRRTGKRFVGPVQAAKTVKCPTFVRKQDKQSHSSMIMDEPLWVLLPIVQMIEPKCEQSDGMLFSLE